MKYFKKIEGSKIYLSPINSEDYLEYTKWMNDFGVTNNLGRSGNLVTIESEKKWLENINQGGNLQFAIIKKEDDKLIGNCGFNKLNYLNQNAEIGIFIGDEENRGKGFGSEALKLLLDYGFNYLNMNNIMLRVISFNDRALNTYLKCGFKKFGIRHKTHIMNNTWYDTIFMEILKEDYFTKDKK